MTCDNDGDGEMDDCLQCDLDDDGVKDSCLKCDINYDGVSDSCFLCTQGIETNELPTLCYPCDDNGDGLMDTCFVCDGDHDGLYESCKPCDLDADNINDECKTCDHNVDSFPESCKPCDLDGNGILDSCYLCDMNGDGVFDACPLTTNYPPTCVSNAIVNMDPIAWSPAAASGAPYDSIVCLGDSITASASLDGSPSREEQVSQIDCMIITNVISRSPSNDVTYTVSGPYSGSGDELTVTFTAESAGAGTVTFSVAPEMADVSLCGVNGTWNQAGSYAVVEVASLIPNEGTAIDDGDGDENTTTYLVCKEDSGEVTVTATANPALGESDLPSCWSLDGGEGSGKLVRTVDQTVEGETVIRAEAGTSYKEVTLIVIDVLILPAWEVVDEGADSSTYSVMVSPSVADVTYLWSWSAPEGVGNNPNVNYSDSSARETYIIRSHWFASPNDTCSSLPDSEYTLECTIAVGGATICKAIAALNVRLIDPAGVTYQPSPLMSGSPLIAYDSTNGIYYIEGPGTLQKNLATIEMFLDPNSEFMAKTIAHENKHKDNYDNGFDGHEFFTVNELYNRIKDFTDTSFAGLKAQIIAEGTLYYAEEQAEYDGLEACDEVSAFGVSDSIDPQYYYHNCGRFSCSP